MENFPSGVSEALHSETFDTCGEISQRWAPWSNIVIIDDDSWYNCQHHLRKALGAHPVGALLPTSVLCVPGDIFCLLLILICMRWNFKLLSIVLETLLAPCSGLYFYICDLFLIFPSELDMFLC